MSPEMLLKLGHNRTIDYYAVGVILYEMLVGIPPFYNNNRKTMYTSILKDDIKFFQHMSKDVCDLISKLMEKDPRDRLGTNYGFFEIKQHPFFSKVNWRKVEKRQVVPPFVPSVRETNFSPDFTNIPIDLDFINDKILHQRSVKTPDL
jgi:serum/glucocorticoid-regulated kinase 2